MNGLREINAQNNRAVDNYEAERILKANGVVSVPLPKATAPSPAPTSSVA